MSAFLNEAGRIVADVQAVQVRQATALMADALEQSGFYAAYEMASSHPS
jgi:hypothetical protein